MAKPVFICQSCTISKMFQLKLFTQAHFQTTPAPNDKIMISHFFEHLLTIFVRKIKTKTFATEIGEKRKEIYLVRAYILA